MINTCPTELPTHIYTFTARRLSICVKATDLVDAIHWLRVTFGEHWVQTNIDTLDISWNKPNHK